MLARSVGNIVHMDQRLTSGNDGVDGASVISGKHDI